MVMGMAKYADITPFYEWLEDLMRMDDSKYPDHQTLMFYEIIDKLDSLPEVVRCKDCKHYMLWEDSEDKRTCSKSIGLMISDPDDFCSYGERKDNE
jgi:hypothetical protein